MEVSSDKEKVRKMLSLRMIKQNNVFGKIFFSIIAPMNCLTTSQVIERNILSMFRYGTNPAFNYT